MSGRVIHFDIYVDDVDRASNFYKYVFGWEFEKMKGHKGMDYWMIMTGPTHDEGIDGGMMLRESKAMGDRISLYIDTKSVSKTIEKIEEHGGSIAVPKTPVTGHGWMAQCHDTEGNRFGLMEKDKNAK